MDILRAGVQALDPRLLTKQLDLKAVSAPNSKVSHMVILGKPCVDPSEILWCICSLW
jgi:hypothetical protein